ncbi:hypothetical protein F164LOC_15780 [Pectobacterium carotovorum]|nr:hypothetical protein F164LOC_15780 [Pectobacterium carotovorum]
MPNHTCGYRRYCTLLPARESALNKGIPLENAFSARLLILRELMHHHGFDFALILRLPAVTA